MSVLFPCLAPSYGLSHSYPFPPWPLHWHSPFFPHAQLNTHTHTRTHSLSSFSASVIRLLSPPVIGISCEWSGPRWQLHKESDRCLQMRHIREKMASLLLLLTPWPLSLFRLSAHLEYWYCRIACIGSNKAETSYNIKELLCLPLKVLFAS